MNKFVVRLAVLALLALGFTYSALAQSDFEILSKSKNPEQEYRQELDKWMLRAYEGDRDAQFKVGVLFANEQFNQPDHEQAVYWYRQAARQGHVLAQYNIGHQYLTGVGVPKNEQLAMQWWLQAAKQDHAQAQFNIGRAYYLGIGLEEDQEKSKYWFNRAASNQEPKSIEILKQLGWGSSLEDSEAITAAIPAEMPGDESRAVIDTSDTVATNNTDTSGELAADEKTTSTPMQSVIAPRQEVTPAVVTVEVPAAETDTDQGSTPSEAVTAISGPITAPPIALYTNPKVRSVLITLAEGKESLTVVERDDVWLAVTSSEGFPVWVHGDYVSVTDQTGTITGSAVNARSVPIITNGTVVGRLEKNEVVSIIDKRKEWYRVIAPPRFKAWVKADDFEPDTMVGETDSVEDSAELAAATVEVNTSMDAVTPVPKSSQPAPKLKGPRPVNDNEWLYSQPSDGFTLQLASFDDPVKIKEFVSRNKFDGNAELHQFTSSSNDIKWTYFLYGTYADKPTAEAVKKEINQQRAWIRSFGLLQQNRCITWKKQLPTPRELNKYCGS